MGAMIFQLPNTRFPETPPVKEKPVYDELRGYLHSRTLRWSSGAMRGRPQALWGEQIGFEIDPPSANSTGRASVALKTRTLEEVLDTVVLAGFGGIYIDRRGLTGEGQVIVARLQTLLGTAPIENGDRHLVFFSLRRYAQTLRANFTREQWEAARRDALELPSAKEER
jgi:phosphoglycerol transferase